LARYLRFHFDLPLMLKPSQRLRMIISRIQEQAAYQQVLTALAQSVTQLGLAAACIDDPLISNTLRTLAVRRFRLYQLSYRPTLRSDLNSDLSSDLSSDPSSDLNRATPEHADLYRATNQKLKIPLALPQGVGATLSHQNSQPGLLIGRIRDEERLLVTVEDALQLDWSQNSRRTTLKDLAAHLRRSVSLLREVAASLNII
jgi:hypothetical protein